MKMQLAPHREKNGNTAGAKIKGKERLWRKSDPSIEAGNTLKNHILKKIKK